MTPLDDSKVKALQQDPNFAVLCEVKRILDSSRIWGGMSWTYHPIHPFKYEPLRDKIDSALSRIKQQYGVEE